MNPVTFKGRPRVGEKRYGSGLATRLQRPDGGWRDKRGVIDWTTTGVLKGKRQPAMEIDLIGRGQGVCRLHQQGVIIQEGWGVIETEGPG